MQDSSVIDVHTEVFEGPLDLLLYLIKKDNLDIYDIPIAQITQEYLTYLDVIKELNLDTAGEFLLMAATLMQIKVRMLLPSQAETEQDQGPDPRVELSAKLAEYEKYKAAALLLDSKYDAFKDIFYRGSPKFSESDKVLNLELFDLLAAVKRAFDTAEDDGRMLSGELFPIETRIEKIAALLRQREWILLDDVFKGEKKRMGIITCFMALLEMIKQRKIFARQDTQFGEIRIYLSKEDPVQEAAPQQTAEAAPAALEQPQPAVASAQTAEAAPEPFTESPAQDGETAASAAADSPALGEDIPPAAPTAEEAPKQEPPDTPAAEISGHIDGQQAAAENDGKQEPPQGAQ